MRIASRVSAARQLRHRIVACHEAGAADERWLRACLTRGPQPGRRSGVEKSPPWPLIIPAPVALIDQQVEGRRLTRDLGQEAMRLATMMGLVIEEMQEQWRQMLLEVGGAPRAVIADRAREVSLRESRDIFADARVLGAALGAQLREILVEDAVELPGHLTLAGESVHQDYVAHQQMVQGAVQRAEERAAIAPVLGVGDARRGLVEPLVDPAVVRGKHFEERFHWRGFPATSRKSTGT